MSINPYAPPQAPVEAEPAQGCWREGKELVMQPGSALPNRCVKCNDAALEPIPSRWISWHHPGWYFLILLNIVIYAIVAMVIRKRQKIAPGLCSRHRRLRRTFLTIGWVGFFLGFALVPIGLSADAVGLVLLGPLVLLVSLIVGILGSRIVYPARITKEEIRLKGCGAAFLNSLQG